MHLESLSRRSRALEPLRTKSAVETVAKALENYANRGVFRGFSRGNTSKTHVFFQIVWHRDRTFEFSLDEAKRILRISPVLPEVPARSAMYAELKAFVALRQSEELPPHRRIDPKKATVACSNRRGDVAITLTSKDRDYQYATRALVHLVDEIYKSFLNDGRYYAYLVETFHLDPDQMS
jgi:hypothetical protein